MIIEPIFGAARLANIGIAALVAESCFWCLLDIRHAAKTKIEIRRVGAIPRGFVIAIGILFAASSFAFLTMPVSHYLFQWPASGQLPALELLGLWLKGAMGAALVLALAQHPRRKMAILSGWTLTSYVFIVGPALWTLIR